MQYSQVQYETKTVLLHDYLKTVDTNLHQVNPVVDLEQLEGMNQITLQNIEESGLLQAASIPITLQSVELVIACIKHYNPTTREIRAADGRIVCSLKPQDIERCFDIPSHPNSKVISLTECEKAFETAKDKCQRIMAEKWLKVTKANLPKPLGRGECKDEYAVLITLLNRITGEEDGRQFQPWMYYVIAKIIGRREYYDWATLISDTLHRQITGYLEAHRFHMCSYLVYLIAFQGDFRLLNNVGTLGVQKVHEFFTRLEFTQAERHFKKTSDHFTMHIVRELNHEMHVRISQTAREAMADWADWFIQFPTFSYIRVYGYIGHPAMLPRHPSDRVVFMEFLRQLSEVHILKESNRILSAACGYSSSRRIHHQLSGEPQPLLWTRKKERLI